MEILLKARTFAQSAHKNQIHGGAPITDHLDKVEKVLIRYGYQEDTFLVDPL